jgi:hypothetical protein
MVLPNVGHMVPNTEPELVIREIEAMVAGTASDGAAAAN